MAMHDRQSSGHDSHAPGALHGHGENGTGIGWPVAALAALIAAVIWFGLAPVPPKVAGAVSRSVSPPPCGGCGTSPTAAATEPQPGRTATEPVDPLPSWNDGPTKRSILDFMTTVTRADGAGFVPVRERVAVFDHDGTLVCEKPIVHGMFFIDRVRRLAQRRPEMSDEEPFATLLAGDIDFVRRLGRKYFLDLMFSTLAGVSEETLEAEARRFLTTARHPVFDVPYADVTFQPMKELIALLRENHFSVWICSASGVHFMRPAAEDWYGIGPEHVIASRATSVMREAGEGASREASGGSPNRRLELVVTPELQVLNDEERKPVSIGEQIGRRPIFAAGNVGTTGDIEMLRWSQSSRHPSLQLLVLHDDADREMAYGEASNASLEAAAKYGWSVVRMASDWNRIFATPLTKKAVVAPSPSAQAGPVAPPSAEATGPARWENEIAAFEAADRAQPPAPGGVMFLGSSNIRMWTTLAEDFAGLNPLNRGLGGARLAELVPVAVRLVRAAKPAVVVVSAGVNDVAAGATPEEVRAMFVQLVENLRREAPAMRIVFLAIAPSIQRWSQRDRQQAANAAVREYVMSQAPDAGVAFVDASAGLLDPDGRPAVECFLDDQLHPSTIGNARRAAIIRPRLIELLR